VETGAAEAGRRSRARQSQSATSRRKSAKWNRIKHCLFSFIRKNWRGKPLIGHEVIVNLIAATTTRPACVFKVNGHGKMRNPSST
jgi:hypothetical protein